MTGMTRTFIAVALPEETRLAVERLQDSILGEIPGLRRASSRQLHLTIAFLGDVPTAHLDHLGDAIAGAVEPMPPFELSVSAIGAFPNPNRARVLWAGITGESLPALEELQRAVVLASKAAGHPPADTRFHPHVTLARSKGGRGPSPNLRGLCELHQSWCAGALPVATVEIIASELSPEGPRYTVLRSAPLRGRSA